MWLQIWSYPCQNQTCEIEILEETNCKLWSCDEYNPSGKTKNHLTEIAITVALLSILVLFLCLSFKIKSNGASLNEDIERQQNIQLTTLQNANTYFALNSSSSEEHEFDDENLELRTPIIRPRTQHPFTEQ